MNHEQNAHLSPAAYRLLAVLTAAIGLVASAVTARFFVLGLERMESDSLAREALIAAGLLMIVVELAAFGLAALLPRQKLRGLRMQLMLIGLLLVSFEGVTIYVTQYLLVRGADAHSQGDNTKIKNQKEKLAGKREKITLLLAKAARESASPYAWIRDTSAATLRDADAMEASASTEAKELARLQAERRPTLTDALGEHGMLTYSVARALLISVMGLVMFGASGALLRASRPSSRSPHPAAPTSTTATAATGTAAAVGTATGPAAATGSASGPAPHGFAHGQQATPAGASATVPYPTSGALRRWAAAGLPIAAIPSAFAAPTVTIEAPVMTTTVTPPTVTLPPVTADTVTTGTVTPGGTVTISAATTPTVTGSASTGQPRRARTVTASTATTRVRYERIRAGIEAGTITPSVRAVQAAEGGGTAEVRACLRRLEHDGILVRTGQGYARRRISDPNQIALAI